MKQTNLVVATLLVFAGTVICQSQVSRPAWSLHPSLGGVDPVEAYVPREYSGGHTDLVKLQLQKRSWRNQTELISFRFSPTSGILAVEDLRGASPAWMGWDTGNDRVYSCTVTADTTSETELLCSIWDDTLKVSRLVRITIPQTGSIQQSVVGPNSATNAIWVGASFVDGVVYLFDIQDFHIKRLIDTNQDGAVDTIDPAFSVGIPTTRFRSSATLACGAECLPIGGFSKSGGEVVTINSPPGQQNMFRSCIFVKFQNSKYVLCKSDAAPSASVSLSSCWLTKDQSQVFVTGTPEILFSLEIKTAAGQQSTLVTNRQIQPNGTSLVTLPTKLCANCELRAVALAPNGQTSPWKTIENSSLAVLFEVSSSRDIVPSQTVEFLGDKFPKFVVGKFKDDNGNIHTCATNRVNSGKVVLEFPAFVGTSTAPFPKAQKVSFWLQDTASGQVVTNRIDVRIRHN